MEKYENVVILKSTRLQRAERLSALVSQRIQIFFYGIVNAFAAKLVEGFFDDVTHMGGAAMLAILSLVCIAVGVYYFIAGIIALMSHDLDFLAYLTYSFTAIIAAKLSVELAKRVLAEEDED